MSTEHIVIVGGSKGLGRVMAGRYLKAGHSVSILSRGIDECYKTNANVNHVSVDLEFPIDKKTTLNKIVKFAGNISHLVFCQRFRGDGDNWDREIQVGLTATRDIIDLLSYNFANNRDSSIVVVSSVYAQFVGSSQPLAYHVVKGGLNQLIKYYAWKLGKLGVRVNGIMPLTYIKPETQTYYSQQLEKTKLYQQFVPLGRMGDANDSANAIEFLCSRKSSFITGQCIFIDGGLSVIWQEELGLAL